MAGIPATEFIEQFKREHPEEWAEAVERNQKNLLKLCPTCKVEPQTGMIAGYWYKRCPVCMAKNDAKRKANREAKLRRQAEAIRNAGH